MADTRSKSERTEHPVQRGPRQESRPDWARWNQREQSSFSPFALMRQGIDEMDHWFSRLGFGQGRTGTSAGRGWFEDTIGQMTDWSPAVEAFQRGNEFVVRAEVPGMNRDDLTVEAGDDAITIRGERKHEQQDERDGMYWSERSYGTFSRVVPLPPGTITDTAKATFANGVLEIVMQAPSQEARRGRRIDISGTPEKPDKS